MTAPATLVPYLSYVDAKAAIAFLVDAFGFELIQSFDGPDGRLMHGEMRCGGGAIVMLGSVDDPAPKASPGLYLVVADVDAHFLQAEKARAEIVYPPEDTEFGTRRYRCKDPEGHEWSFGTYAPQLEAPAWT